MPLSLVDAINPATSSDSKVAVYLYDMEENPIACATFEQASEEEAAMYEELFYGESESESGEGEDDGPDAAAINPLEDDTSSASGGLELVSAFVAGVSLFASAILVFVWGFSKGGTFSWRIVLILFNLINIVITRMGSDNPPLKYHIKATSQQ